MDLLNNYFVVKMNNLLDSFYHIFAHKITEGNLTFKIGCYDKCCCDAFKYFAFFLYLGNSLDTVQEILRNVEPMQMKTNEKSGCSCVEYNCGCCIDLDVPEIKLKDLSESIVTASCGI